MYVCMYVCIYVSAVKVTETHLRTYEDVMLSAPTP